MTDTTYKVHTKSNGTLIGEFNSAGPNITTRGQDVEFTLWLPPSDSDLVVSDSVTIAGTNAYDTITVESGGTLTITGTGNVYTGEVANNGTIDNQGTLVINSSFKGSFENVIQYGDYAGKTTTVELLSGEHRYREFVSASPDIDSLLVGIEPSNDLQNKDITGVWGVISGVSDPRGPALNTHRYTITITILAEYSEFSDHNSAETTLKV